jgi:hypothetical protein
MLKPYRFTLQMPACVLISATGRVDPYTSGTSSPPAPATNRSTIAVGKMRWVSPISVTT